MCLSLRTFCSSVRIQSDWLAGDFMTSTTGNPGVDCGAAGSQDLVRPSYELTLLDNSRSSKIHKNDTNAQARSLPVVLSILYSLYSNPSCFDRKCTLPKRASRFWKVMVVASIKIGVAALASCPAEKRWAHFSSWPSRPCLPWSFATSFNSITATLVNSPKPCGMNTRNKT
jgi:hypothetical protein